MYRDDHISYTAPYRMIQPPKRVFFDVSEIPAGFEDFLSGLHRLEYEFFTNSDSIKTCISSMGCKSRPSTSMYNFTLTVVVGDDAVLRNHQRLGFVQEKHLPIIVDPHNFIWAIKVLSSPAGQFSSKAIEWLISKAICHKAHALMMRSFDKFRPED